MSRPNSPCVGACYMSYNEKLDIEVCEGCYRTGDEIFDWPHMDDTDKEDTLQEAELRRIIHLWTWD